MYILDKNTDYYDYYSHIYGEDKSITFDRRGSTLITDTDLVDHHNLDRHTYRWRNEKLEQHIILEIGTVQYIIKLHDFVTKKTEWNGTEFVSCKMKIVHVFQDNKNKFGHIISIHFIEWYQFNSSIKNIDYSDYKLQKENKYDYRKIVLPILAKTQITSLISPDTIWKEICNYISSMKNDKDTYVVPDIEKVVNHGFDKRESFRNVK